MQCEGERAALRHGSVHRRLEYRRQVAGLDRDRERLGGVVDAVRGSDEHSRINPRLRAGGGPGERARRRVKGRTGREVIQPVGDRQALGIDRRKGDLQGLAGRHRLVGHGDQHGRLNQPRNAHGPVLARIAAARVDGPHLEADHARAAQRSRPGQ